MNIEICFVKNRRIQVIANETRRVYVIVPGYFPLFLATYAFYVPISQHAQPENE